MDNNSNNKETIRQMRKRILKKTSRQLDDSIFDEQAKKGKELLRAIVNFVIAP